MTAAPRSSAPVDRLAARVLLVDADDRVLLFRGCDPDRPEQGSWWFTPGGGVDPGETTLQAAVRELREETGLALPPDALGEVVHVDRAEFALAGTSYRQTGEFFLARIDRHAVDTAGFSDFEQTFVLEHRWWTPQELAATTDRVFPPGLPALLARTAGGRWC